LVLLLLLLPLLLLLLLCPSFKQQPCAPDTAQLDQRAVTAATNHYIQRCSLTGAPLKPAAAASAPPMNNSPVLQAQHSMPSMCHYLPRSSFNDTKGLMAIQVCVSVCVCVRESV
jgi:hypothetical protein